MTIGKFKNFWQWVALILFGITLSVAITINSTWLYQLNIQDGKLLHLANITLKQMMLNYHQLLAYLNYPWVTELKMSDFKDSVDGLHHFRDVKHLFLANYVILIVSAWPAWRLVRSLHQREQQWRLIRPMQIILAVIIFLVAMMLMNFQAFFIKFHEILFRNNDWEFYPAQDPIINVLPENFFAQAFLLFFILVVIYFIALYWDGKRYFKKDKVK
ncbi:TIGR01906 family membrane protein [Periweissella cryptocerci]|uniref:TIGR01906 family membrane protein n=1 Tax=Periweissella cryptocerci TaxID=2506420 RepID=UPI001FAAA75C|nr:TIGR01906 family membrane protein [Periweissella cryptocerci]